MRYYLPVLLCFVFFLVGCETTPSSSVSTKGGAQGPQTLVTPKDYSEDEATGQGPFAEDGIGFQKNQASLTPKVKVALLLPLSGSAQDIGQSMLKASQLALFDLGAETFELLPFDTRGEPATAKLVAQQAVNEGVELIIGPLFSGSVEAVRPVVSRTNINVVAFSTDWTKASGNVHLMGFMPFIQVERITDYAARQGLSRIALIAKNDKYGQAVERTFINAANRKGVQIPQMIRLAQPNLSIADLQSLREANLDAVFLTFGGQDASNISYQLSNTGMSPLMVKRLGTGLLDDQNLSNSPALDGAWFAAPAPVKRQNFEKNYKDLYGVNPPRLATLAYDATALSAVLGKMGGKNASGLYIPAYDKTSLRSNNGFAGIDGVFRFNQRGLIERQLSILEYRDGKIIEIDAAKNRF